MKPQYSKDWWTGPLRTPFWEKHVLPIFAGGGPIVALEVGSFEGMSCLWMLSNLLIHPQSVIHCVDSWREPAIERAFDTNICLSGLSHKVQKHKREAVEFLRNGPQADVVYIDADHTARAAFIQAALAWPRLRPGGILVFDDYPWTREDIPHTVAEGIDAWLKWYGGEYELLHKEWQVMVRKLPR